jgi:hypothetical protein
MTIRPMPVQQASLDADRMKGRGGESAQTMTRYIPPSWRWTGTYGINRRRETGEIQRRRGRKRVEAERAVDVLS